MRSQFAVSVRTECLLLPQAVLFFNTQRREVCCHVLVYGCVFMSTACSLRLMLFLTLRRPIGGFTTLHEVLLSSPLNVHIESSKFVVVSAITRKRTVLFQFPGHPVLFCFL